MRAVSKTVVLTTRENFVWASMQEIIPFIETAWLKSASARGALKHEVVVVNVDEQALPDYLPLVMQADRIVFTCFTVKLARLGEAFRKHFSFDARYVIYLHNQATIAAWPLHEWGLGSVLRTTDVFISSSTYDARTLALSFTKPRVRVIPFTLDDAPSGMREKQNPGDPIDFVYAGRISEQKQLNGLLTAYFIFRLDNPGSASRLTIYGAEDNLGSPNMGLNDSGLLSRLQEIVRLFGIEKHVNWAGHFSRRELHRRLAKPHVFVSHSVHSDENFGMSALRSLALGMPAVLSHWGGHADFATHFPSRAFVVDVLFDKDGPVTDTRDFAKQMTTAAHSLQKPVRRGLPAYYGFSNIVRLIGDVVRETREAVPARALKATPLGIKLWKRRGRQLAKHGFPSKIFKSYADPAAQAFFIAYGMSPKSLGTRKGGR